MQYIENCNSTDFMFIVELCQKFSEITMWTKPEMADVRQNTVYGIGVFAKHMNPQTFKSLVPSCI